MNSPKKILIVDDDRAMGEELAEALGESGYAVRSAAGGEDALRALAAEPADLMLVDMKMPGMSGLETTRRVRRDHPGVKTILITASLPSEMEAALNAEPDLAVIYKPFAIDRLLSRIAAALALGENQPQRD
ncbi:MAG: response regulator [Candidatus Aureabacteria bacterium]|nr:response regulator [Candidatus Auribacterota bacterium]